MKSFKLNKQMLLVILLGVLLAGASWWFFAKPATEKLNALEADVSVIEADLQSLTKQRENIVNGMDPLDGVGDKVQIADNLFALPQDVRETKLAAAISTSASARGIQDTSLDVQPAAEGGVAGLQVTPVIVSASGSQANILGWLEDLRSSDGIRTVEGVTLSSDDTGYQVSFTLKVWFSSTPPLSPSNASSSPDAANPPAGRAGDAENEVQRPPAPADAEPTS